MTIIDATIGVLSGIFSIGIFTWLAMALHMGYTKIDTLLSYFENSPGIRSLTSMKSGGPQGMILIIGAITGTVAFPASQIKTGHLSKADLDNLPPLLRRKLANMYITLLVLIGGLAVTVLSALALDNL